MAQEPPTEESERRLPLYGQISVRVLPLFSCNPTRRLHCMTGFEYREGTALCQLLAQYGANVGGRVSVFLATLLHRKLLFMVPYHNEEDLAPFKKTLSYAAPKADQNTEEENNEKEGGKEEETREEGADVSNLLMITRIGMGKGVPVRLEELINRSNHLKQQHVEEEKKQPRKQFATAPIRTGAQPIKNEYEVLEEDFHLLLYNTAWGLFDDLLDLLLQWFQRYRPQSLPKEMHVCGWGTQTPVGHALQVRAASTLRVLLSHAPVEELKRTTRPEFFVQYLEPGFKQRDQFLVQACLDGLGSEVLLASIPDDEGVFYLCCAAESGNLSHCKLLVEKRGVSVSEESKRGYNGGWLPSSMGAATGGDVPVMQYLLEQGAPLTTKDDSVLAIAACCGHYHLCKYLVDTFPEMKALVGESLQCVVRDCTRIEQRVKLIHLFLENGASLVPAPPSEQGSKGRRRPILFEAFEAVFRSPSALSLVDALLEAGADLHQTNTDGDNGLHYAARGAYKLDNPRCVANGVQLLQYLIAKGLDPTVPDAKGNFPITLLLHAHQWGAPLLEVFLKAVPSHAKELTAVCIRPKKETHAEEEPKTFQGNLVHLACAMKDVSRYPLDAVLKLLKEHGADFNARDSRGRTPLLLVGELEASKKASKMASGRGFGGLSGMGAASEKKKAGFGGMGAASEKKKKEETLLEKLISLGSDPDQQQL